MPHCESRSHTPSDARQLGSKLAEVNSTAKAAGEAAKKARRDGNSIAAGPLSQSAFAPLGQRGAQKDGRVGKVDQRSQGGR